MEPAQEKDSDNEPRISSENATVISVSSSSKPGEGAVASQRKREFGFVPIPKWLRYDPERPAHFGLLLNAVFGFASTFVVANLYYCQPLLIQFSVSFDVTYEEVSRIPTLVQAGYAAGLLLITPLGDLVRRRPLLLTVTAIAATLSIGLPITRSLHVFEALSFLVGMSSVAPQILIPLAADLAPPERRASAISIVLAGLLLGVLIARVLAGIIAQYVTWRIVYYMSIGLQYAVLGALYWTLPDYPAKNPGLGYVRILWSMAKLAVTEPKLIQCCLISIASSACFTNFWVTLTFLLGGPPYNYLTLVIGLFGLIGMFGVGMAPIIGRTIDRLVAWYATLVATIFLLAMQAIYTGAAGVNIAAVIIVCLGLDVGRQSQQVSMTTAVFGISEAMRARLNAVLILSIFIGQVTGTAVGSKLFTTYGWRASAGLSLGLTGFMLCILLLRGPHCERYTWFGYEGGTEWRKDVVMKNLREKADAQKGREAEAEKSTGHEKDGDHAAVVGPSLSGGDAEKQNLDRKDPVEMV